LEGGKERGGKIGGEERRRRDSWRAGKKKAERGRRKAGKEGGGKVGGR
jgi:hypothetical protein